jgi:hypothetical protein
MWWQLALGILQDMQTIETAHSSGEHKEHNTMVQPRIRA